MILPDKTDLAWAAGLFDGEGTVGVRRNGDKARLRRIGMSVRMSCKDAVEKWAQIAGTKITGPIIPSYYPNAKPLYSAAIQNFEGVQAAIAKMWPWLSEEKRNQARKTLLTWYSERHGHKKDYCKRGHNLNETRRKTPGGSMYCTRCQPIRAAEYRAKIRLALGG